MAKGKKKRGKKSKGGGGGGNGATSAAFWGQLVRETLGNFAGQLMADGAEQMAGAGNGKGGGGGDDEEPQDVAADVLCALSESGPKSIADLITEAGTGLTPLLQALGTLREFRLVELNGNDEDAVQLTSSGMRTASALRRGQIEHEGLKQLAS